MECGTKDWEALKPYAASIQQMKILEACIETGGINKAARLLGVDQGNAARSLRIMRSRYAQQAVMLDNGRIIKVDDPQFIKATSTLYDAQTGEQKLSWVKTDTSKEKIVEMLRESVAAMSDDIPRLPAIKSPKVVNSQLLNCYVITDYHLGMLSWQEETGEAWDTAIAESLLVKWFEAAIASSPDAHTGVFAQIGDFMHFDGLDSVTPTGGHLLDADTRFAKVVRIAIHLMRRVIDMLLHKHKIVHVLMAEGNHDIASSVWLRELFAAMYEKEKRIIVHREPDPYYCIEHGKTSLFFHHGHKRKPANVDDVFVAKFREVFGRTKYSYAHMGHMHHVDIKETNLMVVEQHRTLAAKDAYASRGGWLSGREASAITYHKDYGYTGRVVITPEMVK
jgi:hypothetical protein